MSFLSRRISRLARANLNNNHSIPPRLNSEQFLSNLEEARVYTRRTVATLDILLSGKGFKCVLDRQPFFPQELLVHGWVVMHSNDSDSERCIVVVDQVPNRTEMITQLLRKGK